MYNPGGNDNNREFVEVLAESGSENLSGWKVGDMVSNDTLTPLQYTNSNYAIIVEEGYSNPYYQGCNASIYHAGASIGNNLNNDADTIFLYDKENNLVAAAQYDGSIANDNGKSIEFYNGSWFESLAEGGTPCGKNSIVEYFESMVGGGSGGDGPVEANTTVNITINTTATTTNATANATTDVILNGNEILNNSIGNSTTNNTTLTNTTLTNITLTNITITDITIGNITQDNSTAVFNSTNGSNNVCESGNQTSTCSYLCNVSIGIMTDKVLYNDSEKVRFSFSLSGEPQEYRIEYWIEDLFGKIVKARYTTANIGQKTWTAETEKSVDVFLIRAVVVSGLNCTGADGQAGADGQSSADGNGSSASAMIIVKGDENAGGGCSSGTGQAGGTGEASKIKIIGVTSPKESPVNFGATVSVRLELYKGNTGKTLVSAYVEDKSGKKASETTSIYLHDKYRGMEITAPIHLKPNCDMKLEPGEYTLVVEGIDDYDEESIILEGISESVCKEKIIYTAEGSAGEGLISGAGVSVDADGAVSMSAGTALSNGSGNLPKIKSFYSLVKKYSPDINLFAGIEFPGSCFSGQQQNETFYAVVEGEGFRGGLQLNTTAAGTEKLTFNVNVSEKNNSFMLRIMSGNRTIDEKSMFVDFSGGGSSDCGENLRGITDLYPEEAAPFYLGDEDGSPITGYAAKGAPQFETGAGDPDMTALADPNDAYMDAEDGETVYESVSEKTKKAGIYIFAVAVVISAAALIWKKAYLPESDSG